MKRQAGPAAAALAMAMALGASAVAQITLNSAPPTLSAIHVDAAHPGHAIPRTIFGTFLEPIGNSTYNGLWAEVLENPSFEPGLWSAQRVSAVIHERPELEAASGLGVPLPWEPLDPGEGNRYEFRYGDAANSARSIEVMGVPGRQTGLRQRVYLPVHRELTYKGSLYAKHLGCPDRLTVSLRRHGSALDVLASTALHATDSAGWQRLDFALTLQQGALASLEPADFVIAVEGDERVLLDEVQLFPDDAVGEMGGLDPEMVAMIRDMHTPLIRFGGNFTSGYHWRDGIGPEAKRLSMPNVAWGIPEYNTFGTGEFLHFCTLVNAEPQVALNLGSGTPEEAADWVRYVDEHWKTHGGLLWEMGNELWGAWNTGWPTLDELAPRTLAYSQAVRKADPTARLIATGQDPDHFEPWDARQLANPAGTADYLSTHFVVTTDDVELKHPDSDFYIEASLALPVGLEQRLQAMQQQMDAAGREKMHIAFTEWLWVSEARHRAPRFDNVAGSLLTASMYNMLLRASDHVPVSDMTGVVEFAGIWKKRGRVFGTPAAYVFGLYAGSAAERLVPVTVQSGSYRVEHGITRIPGIADVPYLDVTAAGSADGKTLTLFVVNRSLTRDLPASIGLDGAHPSGTVEVTSVSNTDLFAVNDEDEPERVTPERHTVAAEKAARYTFPRASFTRMVFRLDP